MTWSKFCASIPSPIILATCGIIAFSFGFEANQSPTFPKPFKDALNWSKPILNLPIPYAKGAGLFAVSILLGSKAIDIRTKELVDEQATKDTKKQLDISIKKYQTRYQKRLDCLTEELRTIRPDIPDEKWKEIRNAIREIEAIDKKAEEDSQTFIEVEKWLTGRDHANMKQMLNVALKTTFLKYQLNRQQKAAFKKDMRKCINWLYFSFVDEVYYPMDEESHASAMKLAPNAHDWYTCAITTAGDYMKKALDKKKLDLDLLEIDSRIERLLEGLKEIAESASPSYNYGKSISPGTASIPKAS
ncbi:MAG: hypothetical protein HC881_02580 [Leptolyngbyaceae cyanobacterium SL_7_1]|nr:hypothetical protein [Leptolyngbyaceae cyanobacterium SL_7_1]